MDRRIIIPLGILIGVLLSGKDAAASVVKSVISGKYPTGPDFTKYDALFQKYGSMFGVPWKWLKAVCMSESMLGTNPRVALGLREPLNKASVSYDNLSWGLMQLRVETAKDFEKNTTYADLNNAETSIRLAAKFFAWIMKQFSTVDVDFQKKVIMSYNQGVGGTKKGYTGALPYWEKFQKHMAVINERQP